MWEPRRLTTLWAFMACYRDSFTLPYPLILPFVLDPLACSHQKQSGTMHHIETVGRSPWNSDEPCRKAATYTEQYKQKKRGQTSMPRVGFKPAIPMFERAKTFHALDRAATVMGPK
jgi:hypothetical protein